MVRAVLFDLDDTLFDHRGCARTALEAVHAAHTSLSVQPFAEIERAHAAALEELHREVLAGRVALDDARRERFRRLLAAAGGDATWAEADRAARAYREGYVAARRAIDGALALLPMVKTRARVAVVSNNLLDEQQEKLHACGLAPFVDALVVSEEAGVSKPDPAIFQLALDRIGSSAREAVMIGDSWSADILGARAAGIPAIWFNPAGDAAADPAVPVLRSLVPPEAVLRLVFDADWR
jgi:HAD superfamily hydrolase (TIGR01549 family)